MLLESVNVLIPLSNWILTIVMANPIELTIVRAVPFISGGAFCATKVENRGESAITTIPQKSRKAINIISESRKNINGEIRQHPHDKSNAMNAIRFVPIACAKYPADTHANPPIPMIRNDNNGILNISTECAML